MSTTMQALQKAGLLRPDTVSHKLFRRYAELTYRQGPLRSGEFSFPEAASIRKIVQILRFAKPVRHVLTIPEGLTSQQIASLLQKAPFLTGDVPPIAEGGVLPQTVSYSYGDRRAQIVKRLEDLQKKVLEEIWASRQPDPSIKTRRDLVILASIVERETGVTGERGEIARVFLNRLHRGMKLQSDPTAIYDVSHGSGVLGRVLKRADLKVNEGHNTYVIDGLPESPICAPGRASLEAVAQAQPGDALYFVASGHGGHVFSTSLDIHNQQVRRLRRQLRHATETP